MLDDKLKLAGKMAEERTQRKKKKTIIFLNFFKTSIPY